MPDPVVSEAPRKVQPEYIALFSIGLTLGLTWIVLIFALIQRDRSLSMLSGAVLILMHGTGLWSRLAHRKLSISVRADSGHLFYGEKLYLEMVVRNRKLLPVWIRLELETSSLFSEIPKGGETLLPPFSERFKTVSLTSCRRGVWSERKALVKSGDIFGLHSRTASSIFPGEIVVYPRIGTLRKMEIPFQEFFGIHISRGCIEDPSRYEGTREYKGLRSSRHINWKASARFNQLQENIYEPSSHRKVLFILDVSAPETISLYSNSEGFPDFEHLLTTAATIASELVQTDTTFACITNAVLNSTAGNILHFGRGPEHLGRLLTLLARVNPSPGKPHPLPHPDGWTNGTGSIYLSIKAHTDPEEIVPYEIVKSKNQKLAVFAENGEDSCIAAWQKLGFQVYKAGELVDE